MQPTTIFDELPDAPAPDESRFAADRSVVTHFSRRPCLHPAKSREAGRAIYHEVDFITIHAGDKLSICERPMTEQDAQRFADRYERWKSGQEAAIIGSPLSSLPNMTPTKVEEYKYFKIFTVEQLAEANDNIAHNFMSFYPDKARAKAFLEVAQNNAPVEALMVELQKANAEIENLKTHIHALQTNISKAA